MMYNELEQGNILSEVCVGLASIAYTDISLRSIWAIYRIRQTPRSSFPTHGIITRVMTPQKLIELQEREACMTPLANTERYKNHRFPVEIISHGVWLYYRFTLSYRDVQELLFERGIDVTHEAIRQWCLKFGQDYANRLKRRRAQAGDKWHLDEAFLTSRAFRKSMLSQAACRR